MYMNEPSAAVPCSQRWPMVIRLVLWFKNGTPSRFGQAQVGQVQLPARGAAALADQQNGYHAGRC